MASALAVPRLSSCLASTGTWLIGHYWVNVAGAICILEVAGARFRNVSGICLCELCRRMVRQEPVRSEQYMHTRACQQRKQEAHRKQLTHSVCPLASRVMVRTQTSSSVSLVRATASTC